MIVEGRACEPGLTKINLSDSGRLAKACGGPDCQRAGTMLRNVTRTTLTGLILLAGAYTSALAGGL